MPTTEEQDETLSEIVVREAVGMGMDSPLRDSILEAVEDAEGKTGSDRNLPLAGALFGVGSALGFLAGRRSHELEVESLEDIDEPDIIQNALEETRASDEGMMGGEEGTMGETETEGEDGGGSSKIGRLLLAIGLVAGIAILRQRLSSDEKEEWEPIEEFEPATSDEDDEDTEDESENDTMEAQAESSDDETEE
ncbi:hypothetical protein SAMN04487967_1523 [Natronorubrum sediminis]|uniref:MYXO-CTERM domain-containing protein n=1 Tax=Natronorubrum sediminis TaxID=640943 RepID=A0A1H6FTZ6_9EURY|nr:hypothetical protein [Natronorubrum sediminis]SEH14267.1 hypothetical protein SAMN04487967_1523 [Natronorubrum sediminis]